jgi:SAM-dependent methyltransferase
MIVINKTNKKNNMSILKEKTSDLGVLASTVDLTKLTSKEASKQLRDEIPVLNKFGYEKAVVADEYTEAFVKGSIGASKPVLEIGCAYGHVVRDVLALGGKIVASDLSAEMLEILVRDCPKDRLNNLHVYPARFPDELSFKKESFSAILASRILHFLDGKTIEEGLALIHNWLMTGGKFYFTAISIHHDAIKAFLPTYQERVVKGVKWAGEIENQWEFSPEHKPYVPKFLHIFDKPQLERILPFHGFKIDKISLFNYPDDTTAGDKGHIGFVATKV